MLDVSILVLEIWFLGFGFNDMDRGSLYIVATPIGNLEDITFRAVRVLEEIELIAAEDTRRTKVLLQHYNIQTPLTSYFDHNKERKTPGLILRLKEGNSIAVVSDAGTPGISDPAFYLVRAAIQENISVVPVPGASAVICGVVASGLPTDRFVFEGFLPVKKKRRKRIEQLKDELRTIVIYESPHRIYRTLRDLLDVLGDRSAVICRELTKKFETFYRGNLSELSEQFKNKKIKGELVLIIEGHNTKKRSNND